MKFLLLFSLFSLGNTFHLQTPIHQLKFHQNNKNVHNTITKQNYFPKTSIVLPIYKEKKSIVILNMNPPDMIVVQDIATRFLMFATFYGVLSYLIFNLMPTGLKNGNNNKFFQNNPFQNNQNNGDAINPDNIDVCLDDIAGLDYVKQEINDVLMYLKDPEKFESMDIKCPKGLLLVGPPGTGKTMFAKAIAKEANIPFFSTSGSGLGPQLYIGSGVSAIKNLFEKAKKSVPCIIFIDEFDSIGGQRGKSISSEERDITLNQLLTEMDGFATTLMPVIVIAATNRIDMLDTAVLRPGRFDRKIFFKLPDKQARLKILEVHSKKKPLAADVDLNALAQLTINYNGADLQNILNESGILAIRENNHFIQNKYILEALDKIMIGNPLPDAIRSEKTNFLVSIHESAHALIGLLLNHNTVTRISIIPSSKGSGGITIMKPNDEVDEGLVSKQYLLNELMVLLGGRAGEALIFGKDQITTGASSDLLMSKYLVKEYLNTYCLDDELQFGYKMEDNIHLVLQKYYKKTYDLLSENKYLLEIFAKELLEKKQLYESEIYELFEKNKIKKSI
jgi:cell division protease FtsH